MKIKILQKDSLILRQVAKQVTLKDIRSKKIARIIENMRKTMHAEDDSVAIAAPQIGESLRIFVVNGKIISLIDKGEEVRSVKEARKKDMICINPEIIKRSQKKSEMEEGCLSVRWLYGNVKRSEKVTIHTYDHEGKVWEIGVSGLLAQIFQHEIDHLDGILFIDKAKDLRDGPPNKNKES